MVDRDSDKAGFAQTKSLEAKNRKTTASALHERLAPKIFSLLTKLTANVVPSDVKREGVTLAERKTAMGVLVIMLYQQNLGGTTPMF